MDFIKLVESRQSVRRYSSRPVEKEKIELCLEAMRLAPSACNSQPWHFIVTDEPELKDKLAKATFSATISFNKFTLQSPILVTIILEKPKIITQIGGRIKNKEYPLIDIGIAAEHFCLQAEELGLGTCMMGWFKEKEVKKLLQIPKNKNVGLMIALGYPEDGYKQREKIRKSISQIVSYNTYKKNN